MTPGWVHVRHPETDGVTSIPESALPAYRRRGWEQFDPAPKPRPTRSKAETRRAVTDIGDKIDKE